MMGKISWSEPVNVRRARLLVFNHVDAWAVALIMATIAVFIHPPVSAANLWLVAGVGLVYWSAFALNDYFDAADDALDESKAAANVFSCDLTDDRSRRWMLLSILLPLLPALAILAQFGWRGVLALLIGVLVMWAYSAPPLRLKARPGPDLLLHCCFVETFPFVLVLFLNGAEWGSLDFFLITVALLGSFSAQLEQQLRDYDIDKMSGMTFAGSVGRVNTFRLVALATLLLMGVAVTAYVAGIIPDYLVPFGLLTAPALLHRLVRGPDRARSGALVKVTVVASLLYLGLFVWLA